MNRIYVAEKGINLFLLLQNKNVNIDAFCGGRKTCGKCKIKLLKGFLPINEIEKSKLSQEELAQGIRLACTHTCCEEACTFTLLADVESFEISGCKQLYFGTKKEKGYAVAIDIGTTTVVMELINLALGVIEKEVRFINPQKIYGADVITRIESVRKYGIQLLQKSIIDKIEEVLLDFQSYSIKRMCVCGNATMTHLFMGEDVSSIAKAPYTCKISKYRELDSKLLFKNITNRFVVQILPPISAYVGSDIVMDIYECKQHMSENSLLIDLGTNGEISLYKNNKFIVSSAACGPAFEGGNMSCGCGAIDGAINDFNYLKGIWKYKTINNKSACGICGSGYLSLIEHCIQHGYIEDNGYLKMDININKQIYLSQKDVREFQMAKSAIASACICVCNYGKIKFQDIEHLYIAGGFGEHVKMKSLAVLGIIPNTLLSRVKVLGNSAIQGITRYAIFQERKEIEDIINKSECLLLASNSDFSNEFMKNMMLSELYES